MNDQEKFWAGEGGNDYTKRNSHVDWRARIPFWHDIMKFTGARSVYEVGCGAGWNLSAIGEGSPHAAKLWGCDINDDARRQAIVAGLNVEMDSAEKCLRGAWKYELVFTAGVLIHVTSENLPLLMLDIIAASARYVLAIEYESEVEEMIKYRGEMNRLWKRPYGKLYEDLGLKVLHDGEATGWDRTHYWLCEKP